MVGRSEHQGGREHIVHLATLVGPQCFEVRACMLQRGASVAGFHHVVRHVVVWLVAELGEFASFRLEQTQYELQHHGVLHVGHVVGNHVQARRAHVLHGRVARRGDLEDQTDQAALQQDLEAVLHPHEVVHHSSGLPQHIFVLALDQRLEHRQEALLLHQHLALIRREAEAAHGTRHILADQIVQVQGVVQGQPEEDVDGVGLEHFHQVDASAQIVDGEGHVQLQQRNLKLGQLQDDAHDSI
mmetsp:Transcript_18470/g.32016  ORF Transcript_18470/g.32016 Transcript_18470/m.32016 type:complete len:242 (-) Transcript_18470:3499-4224(-)